MLLHLPIVILATPSPIAISDTLPKFDIAKECRLESESSKAFGRCSHDKADALQQLEAEWPQFVGADRSARFTEATVAGFASYVGLLICPEMARDVGAFTRPSAVLLVLYTLGTALMGHHYWTVKGADQLASMEAFCKDLSIMGGVLLLHITGAGKYSIDVLCSIAAP